MPGPIALFDKSFLHSLNVDEAVWFDHFFISNIAPVFFVETLADLEKLMRNGRTPEQVVGNIAEKTPQMSGNVNAYHGNICLGNLFGHSVPMKGQIVVASSEPVSTPNSELGYKI